jgi:hypothetical protein
MEDLKHCSTEDVSHLQWDSHILKVKNPWLGIGIDSAVVYEFWTNAHLGKIPGR